MYTHTCRAPEQQACSVLRGCCSISPFRLQRRIAIPRMHFHDALVVPFERLRMLLGCYLHPVALQCCLLPFTPPFWIVISWGGLQGKGNAACAHDRTHRLMAATQWPPSMQSTLSNSYVPLGPPRDRVPQKLPWWRRQLSCFLCQKS